MDLEQEITYALFLAIFAAPFVGLALAWRYWSREAGHRRSWLSLGVLLVLTGSVALFVAGSVSENVIGPSYSSRRFTILWVNWAISLGSTIAAGVELKKRGNVALFVFAFLVLFAWSISLAINSMV